MRIAVTGGMGFIGSHFVDEAIAQGHQVRVVDNMRTGRFNPPNYPVYACQMFIKDIVPDPQSLLPIFDGCEWVVHFAANADVRHGLERPGFDIEQNIIGTSNVLNAMRLTGVKRIFNASSASVYGGYQSRTGIREDCPFPSQQSLYGMSKLAAEGLVSSYCEGFGFTGVTGRWVQVVGERYLHGHIIDFIRKVRWNPLRLEILGDGNQQKSGIYVKDLVKGIMKAIDWVNDGYEVFNFGTEETLTVDQSADLICKTMGVAPQRHYTGQTTGGWVGDNPFVLLDVKKANVMLNWHAETPLVNGIQRTVDWLLSDECDYL